jgi:hypothetical protein
MGIRRYLSPRPPRSAAAKGYPKSQQTRAFCYRFARRITLVGAPLKIVVSPVRVRVSPSRPKRLWIPGLCATRLEIETEPKSPGIVVSSVSILALHPHSPWRPGVARGVGPTTVLLRPEITDAHLDPPWLRRAVRRRPRGDRTPRLLGPEPRQAGRFAVINRPRSRPSPSSSTMSPPSPTSTGTLCAPSTGATRRGWRPQIPPPSRVLGAPQHPDRGHQARRTPSCRRTKTSPKASILTTDDLGAVSHNRTHQKLIVSLAHRTAANVVATS